MERLEAQTVGRCTNCRHDGPIMGLGIWQERRLFVDVPGGGELPVDERRWRSAMFCSVRCINRFVAGCREAEMPRWSWAVRRARWAVHFTMGDVNDWRSWNIPPEDRAIDGRGLDDEASTW